MSDTAAPSASPPPASVDDVRAHAGQLSDLARRHGLSNVRVAPTGRLLVAAADADYFDLADFEQAATELLGAEVQALPEGVLGNDFASQDLAAATPL